MASVLCKKPKAFKFPDSMEVHFQCTIQICRYQCPDQCSGESGAPTNGGYVSKRIGTSAQPRGRRDVSEAERQDVGINRIIQVTPQFHIHSSIAKLV